VDDPPDGLGDSLFFEAEAFLVGLFKVGTFFCGKFVRGFLPFDDEFANFGYRESKSGLFKIDCTLLQ